MRAYLGLGTNLGDREENLREALRRLREVVAIEAVSSVYRSAPVGYTQQPDFWNLAVRIETDLSAEALLEQTQRIESAMGREPTFRNAPRPIDIDILLYETQTVRTANLQIPHPRLTERAFALDPLIETDPTLLHPETGEPLSVHRTRAGALERIEKLFPGARLLTLAGALAFAVLTACGDSRSDGEAQHAQMQALLPRLEAATGLKAKQPIEMEVRQREELRDYLMERLAKEIPDEEMRGIEATYRALGLLPDTLNLRKLLIDLYSEQVLGYYDPETKKMYVVEGVDEEALRPVLAHELVHALQDQHASLDSLVDRKRGNDRQTAAQAAIEGHAMLIMLLFQAEESSGGAVNPADLPPMGAQLRPALEAQNEQFPVFRTAPRILRETMLFPYFQGAEFVQTLWRSAAFTNGAGGSRPAPFGDFLPLSTEQVMHPQQRFVGKRRDAPTDIELTPLPSAEGWKQVYETTLGELETSIWLAEHLPVGAATAFGWDGDRLRLMARDGGGSALVWYSVWDDEEAADRFAEASKQVQSGARAGIVSVERLDIDNRPLVRIIAARGGAREGVPIPEVAALQEK